jgi:hypothetical protein
MTAAIHSVPCRCRALLGQPCTTHGNHLARYLTAEKTGVISRDHLKTVIATLTIIAPHVVITDDCGHADRAGLHEERSR